MRSCTNCRPSWRPGPAPAPSADNPSTPMPEHRPNEALLGPGGPDVGQRPRRELPLGDEVEQLAVDAGDRGVVRVADHDLLRDEPLPGVLDDVRPGDDLVIAQGAVPHG